MQYRGIRGAVPVPANNGESTIAATEESLKEPAQADSLEVDDIVAVPCTRTSDLNAQFPAMDMRELRWPWHLALLGRQKMNVPDDLAPCLRILNRKLTASSAGGKP